MSSAYIVRELERDDCMKSETKSLHVRHMVDGGGEGMRIVHDETRRASVISSEGMRQCH